MLCELIWQGDRVAILLILVRALGGRCCSPDVPGAAEIEKWPESDLLVAGHALARYRCARHQRAEVLHKVLPRKLVEAHAVRPCILQCAGIIPPLEIQMIRGNHRPGSVRATLTVHKHWPRIGIFQQMENRAD